MFAILSEVCPLHHQDLMNQELTTRRKDEISIRGMRSVAAGKKRDLTTIPGRPGFMKWLGMELGSWLGGKFGSHEKSLVEVEAMICQEDWWMILIYHQFYSNLFGLVGVFKAEIFQVMST